MRMLVTGKQMKAIDAYTIHTIGIPSLVLMERAALKVALAAERLWEKGDVIWAVCGTGNNGADGVAAARMLHLKGYPVRVFLVGNPDKGTEEFRTQLKIAGNVGLFTLPWQEGEKEECGLLIDAVFGVGLSRPVEGDYRQCIEMLASKSIRSTVAVDVPSGIHGDTGTVMGIALWADLTVTFGWEKTGTALYPGREYAGRVEVADIGFPGQALEAVKEAEGTAAGDFAVTYSDDDLKRLIEEIIKASPNRCFAKKAQYKYKSYGIALLIGRYTGLRISEVMALKKEDFDLERNQLTIRRRIEHAGLKRKEIYLTERLKTKSSKARVEICSILSEYLKSWFVENPYDFVICDEHGDFISPVNFQERIRDTAKKLDIKFHYHMLRHTYATELMVAGVNPIVVRDLLRHSTVNTTWNVYTHPSRDDQRKVLDDLYDDNVEFMDNDMKIRF